MPTKKHCRLTADAERTQRAPTESELSAHCGHSGSPLTVEASGFAPLDRAGSGMNRAIALLAAAASLVISGPANSRRHPLPPSDFTGLWSSASLTELERPDDFKTLTIPEAQALAFEKIHRGKTPDIGDKDNPVGGPDSEWWETDFGLARIRGKARTSWIVAPANGKRPRNAADIAAGKASRELRKRGPDGPEARDSDERCLGFGGAGPPLENSGLNDNFQIVQAGDQLAIEAEWMHDVRTVRIGAGAVHPTSTMRVPNGDSIGHWEGKTLVIETTNFISAQVRAPDGAPGADMRVTERLTRLSPTELLYAFSVTNPARYSQTWSAEMLLHATKGPIYEYACHEGNYALEHMLSAARRLEGKSIDGVVAGSR